MEQRKLCNLNQQAKCSKPNTLKNVTEYLTRRGIQFSQVLDPNIKVAKYVFLFTCVLLESLFYLNLSLQRTSLRHSEKDWDNTVFWLLKLDNEMNNKMHMDLCSPLNYLFWCFIFLDCFVEFKRGFLIECRPFLCGDGGVKNLLKNRHKVTCAYTTTPNPGKVFFSFLTYSWIPDYWPYSN